MVFHFSSHNWCGVRVFLKFHNISIHVKWDFNTLLGLLPFHLSLFHPTGIQFTRFHLYPQCRENIIIAGPWWCAECCELLSFMFVINYKTLTRRNMYYIASLYVPMTFITQKIIPCNCLWNVKNAGVLVILFWIKMIMCALCNVRGRQYVSTQRHIKVYRLAYFVCIIKTKENRISEPPVFCCPVCRVPCAVCSERRSSIESS